MDKQITILSYGDNPLISTGYGQIWDNLLKRLTKLRPKWKFVHLGWQGRDREHITADGYYQIPMGKLEGGVDTIIENLLKYQPEIFITMADVGKQSGYTKMVFEAKKRGWKGKWIMYTPLDTADWAIFWDKIFEGADINLAMAKFGRDQMIKHKVQNIKYIPVGVNTKVYSPLAEREELRRKYKINNKFIAGFVGRNQTRKMLAYWMRGFAKFSKGKDDVVLLLHTDAMSPGGGGRGWLIEALIYKFEKETEQELFNSKKIIFTRTKMDINTRQKITPEGMNEIYNLFDIFLYPTGGEGFGIPGLECQSAGVPILMSNNTTGPELAGETGELIDMLKDKYGRIVSMIGTNGVSNMVPDDNHIALLLNKYYKDWKENKSKLKEMSERSRKFALAYDWDLIAPQFIELFEENI